MKAPLERTSITCKDLDEQPPRQYVLIIPDQNIAIACDDVAVNEHAVVGTEKDDPEHPLVSVHPAIGWIILRNDVAEKSTRGAALRRVVENQLAENEHVKKVMDEISPDAAKDRNPETPQRSLPGYL